MLLLLLRCCDDWIYFIRNEPNGQRKPTGYFLNDSNLAAEKTVERWFIVLMVSFIIRIDMGIALMYAFDCCEFIIKADKSDMFSYSVL